MRVAGHAVALRRAGQCGGFRGEVAERRGLDRQQVERARMDLERALDTQVRLATNRAALCLVQVGTDHHIDHAGLVLQQQEHKSFGRPGPLTTDHQTRGPHARAVAASTHLFGGEHVARQVVPQERQRMVARRESEQAVIGHHPLPVGHVRQLDHVLFGRQRQRQLAVPGSGFRVPGCRLV